MNDISPADYKSLQLAVSAHREGKLEQAKTIYASLVRKYPDSPSILNAMGTVLLDMGLVDEAESYFSKASSQNPPYVPALYNLARIKQVRGKTSEAKNLYEIIVEKRPDLGQAWNNLALILRDEGKAQSACVAMEQAAKLFPDHPEILNNLGVILEALGQTKEAESYFVQAIKLQPEYLSAHFNLACLYHKSDRFKEAERELQWVLSRKPDDPGARYLFQTLGRLPAPERAPAEYVSKTFDDCAVNFEEKLAALGYKTPEMLFCLVRPYLKKGIRILDLGCGTGLGAQFYRKYAALLYGMDCSEKMLNIAQKKGLYDKLLNQDILSTWTTNQSFDCIYSSDCLVYFGNLLPVFSKVTQHLRHGGLFAFTVEQLTSPGENQDFKLGRTGRFAHRSGYVESCLEQFGLKPLEIEACTLRKEAGKPVKGLLVLSTLNP